MPLGQTLHLRLNLGANLRRSMRQGRCNTHRSCFPTLATVALDRIGCPAAPNPQLSNPHSSGPARGTIAPSLPRFPPLEVFVRRPPDHGAPPSWAGLRKPSQYRKWASFPFSQQVEFGRGPEPHDPTKIGSPARLSLRPTAAPSRSL